MPFDAVVADADVLLSATVGKAALRVLNEYGVRVHVSGFDAAEVEEYLPRWSSKYGLPEELVRLQWRLLSVEIHAERVYAERLPAAEEKLGAREPPNRPRRAPRRRSAAPVRSYRLPLSRSPRRAKNGSFLEKSTGISWRMRSSSSGVISEIPSRSA